MTDKIQAELRAVLNYQPQIVESEYGTEPSLLGALRSYYIVTGSKPETADKMVSMYLSALEEFAITTPPQEVAGLREALRKLTLAVEQDRNSDFNSEHPAVEQAMKGAYTALAAPTAQWVEQNVSGNATLMYAMKIHAEAATGAADQPAALQGMTEEAERLGLYDPGTHGEPPNDALIHALAACRDAMPVQARDSDLDALLMEAVSDPLAVPAYVQACIKKRAQPAAAVQADRLVHECDRHAWSANTIPCPECAQPTGEQAAAPSAGEPVASVSRSNDLEGLVQWAGKRVSVGTLLYITPPTQAEAQVDALTEDEIVAVWQSMSGGPDGWLVNFGYLQFARAVLDAARAKDKTQ